MNLSMKVWNVMRDDAKPSGTSKRAFSWDRHKFPPLINKVLFPPKLNYMNSQRGRMLITAGVSDFIEGRSPSIILRHDFIQL